MVDPQADRPVYKQLADLLRSAITSGVLGPGAQLPSEHELVDEHGVSRGTARQAIMLLRHEGLIESVHGLGSFVREPEQVERLGPDRRARGWELDPFDADGHDPDDEKRLERARRWPSAHPPEEPAVRFDTQELSKVAKGRLPMDIAELLKLRTGAAVLVRRWDVLRGDRVQAIRISYVPWPVAKAAGLKQVTTGPAMHAALAGSEHRPVRVVEEVQARLAPTGEAEVLGIGTSTPVIRVQRVSYSADDRPVEVSLSVMSAERYRLVYELAADD